MMYTVTELGRMYNMSPGAIRRLCTEGQLRHIKIGVKILINQAVFEDYVQGTTGTPELISEYGKIRRAN